LAQFGQLMQIGHRYLLYVLVGDILGAGWRPFT